MSAMNTVRPAIRKRNRPGGRRRFRRRSRPARRARYRRHSGDRHPAAHEPGVGLPWTSDWLRSHDVEPELRSEGLHAASRGRHRLSRHVDDDRSELVECELGICLPECLRPYPGHCPLGGWRVVRGRRSLGLEPGCGPVERYAGRNLLTVDLDRPGLPLEHRRSAESLGKRKKPWQP